MKWDILELTAQVPTMDGHRSSTKLIIVPKSLHEVSFPLKVYLIGGKIIKSDLPRPKTVLKKKSARNRASIEASALNEAGGLS